jgi:acyl carrier protein
MSVIEPLTDIFREVFDDEEITLSREMTANDVDGWDSLSHVNLIVTIEARFSIRFSQKELLTFKNVGDLIDSIQSKLPA